MKRLAFYMLYDPAGVVADYVIYKLRKLAEFTDKIIVVCNGLLTSDGRRRLEEVVDVVHVRENTGFDVGAYREGLISLVGFDGLNEYDEILLLNNTFYAPIFPFAEMFAKMDAQNIDFWGITAHDGPTPNGVTGIGILPLYIQSHFIAVRRRMFEKKSFHDYWKNMPLVESLADSALKHETRFTETFSRQGFRYAVYCDPKKYKVSHAAFAAIDTLVDDRCPILKRRPLFQDPHYLQHYNVELPRALSLLKEKTDYDVGLIWKDITRLARPRNLYTNAALLEVLENKGPASRLRAGLRIGVLAHIDDTDIFAEVLSYLRNIPVPFDLYVTTVDSERKREIEETIAGLKSRDFELCCVEVVDSAGRDVSALVMSNRDVVLKGEYDYMCRVHTTMTPPNSNGVTRHLMEHLYENLLGSPAYVSNLLQLFESEERLGIVMPSAIHIGYPTLGNAWLANRPSAEAWASKLGIEVPFDDFTPLAVYGTMWWFRPAALERIVAYPFRRQDFSSEPYHRNGGLSQTLERLFVYAAHQEGYYSKCALTPENAAKNYVNLEYKFQHMIGQHALDVGPHDQPRFPKWAIKHYLNCRLASVPRVRTALQKVYRASRSTYHTLSRSWN